METTSAEETEGRCEWWTKYRRRTSPPRIYVKAKITTLHALVVLESTRVEEIVLGSSFVLREGP